MPRDTVVTYSAAKGLLVGLDGFSPGDLHELTSRRLILDGSARDWWLIAVRTADLRRVARRRTR